MYNPQKPEIELYTEEQAAGTGCQAFHACLVSTDSTPVLGSQGAWEMHKASLKCS